MPKTIVPTIPTPTVALPTFAIGLSASVPPGVSVRRPTTISAQKTTRPATSENALSTWSARIQLSKRTRGSYGSADEFSAPVASYLETSEKGRTMQKITPCLWFDTEGEEAAELYTSIFPSSRIVETTRYGSAGPRAE